MSNKYCHLLFIVLLSLGLTSCGGSDSDDPVPPPTYTIDVSGGTGGNNNGIGGNGGLVKILKYGGTGPIKILKTAGTSPSLPSSVPIHKPQAQKTTTKALGANGYVFSANTTVAYNPGGDPTPGIPYLLLNNRNLYISNGDTVVGNESPVTGIEVAAGVTVTFPLNIGATDAGIDFFNDVDNKGAITTVDASATERGSIDIQCDNYLGAAGSRLDTSSSQTGMNGGDITVVATGTATGSFHNQGTITTTGSDDMTGDGSNGGNITLAAQNYFENSGNISSYGGIGSGGFGGNGGTITVDTWNGDLFNTGPLSSYGGNGNIGGDGNVIHLATGIEGIVNFGPGAGAIQNSGTLTASGGIGENGNGGSGGRIEIYALGAVLQSDADITSNGGSTSTAAVGGNGGVIDIYALPGVDGADFTTPSGDLMLTGNLRSKGGSSNANGNSTGGNGGQVLITLDVSGSVLTNIIVPTLPLPPTGIAPLTAPLGSPVLSLRSYVSINTSGGQGNFGGNGNMNPNPPHHGGSVIIIDNGEIWDGITPIPPLPIPTFTFLDDHGGNVTNEAAINTRGGNVVANALIKPAGGGVAGTVSLSADTDLTVVNPAAEQLVNTGVIDTSGGDSYALAAAPGYNAGIITLTASNSVLNSGALTANGGNDLVNDASILTGFGHDSSEIIIESLAGPVSSSGLINANGGYGESQGGNGALIGSGVLISAVTDLNNSAGINTRGGNADISVVNSFGGNGGDVTYSYGGVKTDTGTVVVTGGIGHTNGSAGTFTP